MIYGFLKKKCGIVCLIKKSKSFTERKWLQLMQFFTAILLFNDALAYIFRGCVGSLGHYMVRISNFMVFILSDVIMFFFHVYVCSYLFEDGEWKNTTKYL